MTVAFNSKVGNFTEKQINGHKQLFGRMVVSYLARGITKIHCPACEINLNGKVMKMPGIQEESQYEIVKFDSDSITIRAKKPNILDEIIYKLNFVDDTTYWIAIDGEQGGTSREYFKKVIQNKAD